MKVALVGISGYGGMMLFQMLNHHPHITEIKLYGHHQDHPLPLSSVVPMFVDSEQQVLPYDAEKIMQNNDLVFFATSAGVTAKLAQPFIKHHFKVIDLSGDYRLRQPEVYEKWYHKPAAPLIALQNSYYGLVEFGHADQQNYIANPGCYATATLLGLAPLLQQQLIDVDSVIVDAKSGTSGAGKTPAPSTHFSQANDNLQMYKVNSHQHIPEIMQQLQKWDPTIKAIQFNTTLLPLTRGLMVTSYAKVKPGINQVMIDAAFAKTYEKHFFVRYMADKIPTLKQTVGTNFCDLGVIYNETTQVVMVVSVLDNLIKGAAGQAIQNFNQLYDFEETAGLPVDVLLP